MDVIIYINKKHIERGYKMKTNTTYTLVKEDGTRFLLDDVWMEDGNLFFELSDDFKTIYNFLNMDWWEPELNGVKYNEKTYLNIIRDDMTFRIDSIRVGNNNDDGSWGLVHGEITTDYPIDMIDVDLQEIPEDEVFTIELEFETIARMFHDQEWWWTKDADEITHTLVGKIDTNKFNFPQAIWVLSVGTLDMDEGYIHGEPYHGKIIKIKK